jgi:hypothetical protein
VSAGPAKQRFAPCFDPRGWTPRAELRGYRVGRAVRFDPDEILAVTRRKAPAGKTLSQNVI